MTFWQLTIDANDPALLARFWGPALGYVPMIARTAGAVDRRMPGAALPARRYAMARTAGVTT